MHHSVAGLRTASPCSPALAGNQPNPWRNTMMNRIRTTIRSKRAAEQLYGVYCWRPGSGR